MAHLVPPKERVFLFSLQAALTTASGFFSTLLAGVLSEVVGARWVVLFALPFFVLGMPLLKGIPEVRGNPPRLGGRVGLWLRLLLPQVVIGVGAGLVIPFLNLYLKEKSSVFWGNRASLRPFFPGHRRGHAPPILVRRLGKLGAIVFVQALSLCAGH